MGGSSGVLDSADAADRNLSVLLPGEPSPGRHGNESIGDGHLRTQICARLNLHQSNHAQLVFFFAAP